METLNLAQTRGYGTGGTLHIVINNQIGFTTSDPRDSRSTLYCTDVVKMIEAPVFHVNGDDPEAVVFVTKLALDYRLQFRHDIVVDIVCFRKLGHNEQDTLSLTQPLMYKRIGHHPGTRKLYADKLTTQGVLAEGEADQLVKDYRQLMEDGQRTIEPVLTDYKSKYAIDWSPFLGAKWTDQADTAVPLAELKRIGERITTVPEGFTVHPLVAKLLNDRRTMAKGEMNLDWGMGEHLAFATLVSSGYAIASPARTRAVARSRTATPCCTTRTANAGTTAPTFRCRMSRKARLRSPSSTPCCPKRRCWASNTVTPALNRTR